jgi:LDH2 family malate/lactate/ureidoglycolate dehydrogenase
MINRRINHKALREFVAALLLANGTDQTESRTIADILVWTDLVGRSSQGTWRLKELLPRLRAGLIQSPCSPELTRKADGVLLVDGHNGFGRYVGHMAMLRTIELARRCGVAIAAVRNSSHFGAGAYYVNLAAQSGLIGLTLTNTPRRVAAYGGLRPIFGTNPIAFGAPLENGYSMLVDFSTSMMAGSVIRKGQESNEPIREGVAVDENGRSVTNPKEGQVFAMRPFGGAKGYCLSLLVEILTGVITGSLMSFQIPSMLEKAQPVTRIGHFFLVIDIASLLPLQEYHQRMNVLVAAIKDSPLEPGVCELLIPGETRWRNYVEQMEEGILLDSKTIESLEFLAAEVKVATPW